MHDEFGSINAPQAKILAFGDRFALENVLEILIHTHLSELKSAAKSQKFRLRRNYYWLTLIIIGSPDHLPTSPWVLAENRRLPLQAPIIINVLC